MCPNTLRQVGIWIHPVLLVHISLIDIGERGNRTDSQLSLFKGSVTDLNPISCHKDALLQFMKPFDVVYPHRVRNFRKLHEQPVQASADRGAASPKLVIMFAARLLRPPQPVSLASQEGTNGWLYMAA